MFGGQLVSRVFEEFHQPAISPELWQISSNKTVPANRKKRFCKSRLPKNEMIGGTFVFSSSEL
jgi:hypothetical protein